MSNILEVTFEQGQTFATATRLWKGDYGQILLIHGPELPEYYEVHFASTKDGTPEVSVGTPEGVNIPNRLLQAEGHIYAWVFLHVGANDGETKFQVKIPVEERGIPIDQETPEDQTAVQQAIAALNAETGRAEAAADAAEVSEQNAKASEDAASLSEQNAEAAAQAAAASAENAELSENGAAESEAAAAISAQEAAASAAAAAASAAEAGGSEETVAEYARQAEQSADVAIQYGVLAVQSAQDAEASAQTAETYGVAAIEAKTDAVEAAATATQKASETSTNAGIATTQAGIAVQKATEAVQAANAAADSADDASDSADAAAASATSANAASTSAHAAKTAAQTAQAGAEAAQTAAETAQGKAEDAQGAAETAQGAAETAQGKAEDAQTAAETAQGLAEAAQTAAEAAQYIAEDAADQAQEWAESIDPDNFASAEQVLSMFPVDTVDGPVVSFPDGADDIPLKSLIIDVNPVQDLHGYDSPWPAGGGKNKHNPDEAQVGYWVNTTTGAIEAQAGYWVSGFIPVKAGDVIRHNNCGSSRNSFFNSDKSQSTYVADPTGPLTAAEDGFFVFVGQTSTVPYDGEAICTINNADVTYAPYENVCPISGWTGVNIPIMGKKLNNPQWWNLYGKYNEFFGLHTTTSGNKSRGVYMKAGVTYHIHYDNGVSQQYGLYGARLGSTSQINLITNAYRRTADVDFTPTVTDKYVFWGYTSADSFPAISTQVFQIEIGSSYTGDTPYNPASRNIVIQLGDTYYGAQLDVLNGILTVDKYKKTVSELTWTKGYGGFYTLSLYNTSPSMKFTGASTTQRLICDTYKWSTYSAKTNGTISCEQSSHVVIIMDSAYSTADEFKTAQGGVEIVYELATPITIQLTPQEINSLLGTNNIWADTGDTHAIYRADIGLYIQKLTGSEEDDMIANNAIASGKYFLVGNRLFLSTAAIAAGATLTPGTNCVETNLAAALNALNS